MALDEADIDGDADIDGIDEDSSVVLPPAVEPPEQAVSAKAEPRTRARPAITGFLLVSMTFLRNRPDRVCDPSGTPRCEGRFAVERLTQGIRDPRRIGLRNVAIHQAQRHPDLEKYQISGLKIFSRIFFDEFGPRSERAGRAAGATSRATRAHPRVPTRRRTQ
ncbi:hypothetical protein CHE218_31360 [Microbacterium sp. che218]